jgi:outer membrane protein OmpA-like peptidoglycan-associated protein
MSDLTPACIPPACRTLEKICHYAQDAYFYCRQSNDGMRALILFLFFLAYAFTVRWYYVCQMKGLCGRAPATEIAQPEEDIRLRNLRLLSGDTVLLQNYDQFAFTEGFIQPRLNDNNNAFLDSVAALLLAVPGRRLTVTGRYAPQERGKSYGFFENYGTARADQLRRLLVSRGIDETRISLDHNLSSDSLLREPMQFSFFYDAAAGIPEGYEKVQFSFTNMTFSDANFAFGSDEFKPGEAFVAYADSVKTYLQLNPDRRLNIVGHTDNIGSDKFNLNLGLRRAKSAKEYFQKLGVATDIQTATEGKKKPVATNETDEGRQKNRRVNFILE